MVKKEMFRADFYITGRDKNGVAYFKKNGWETVVTLPGIELPLVVDFDKRGSYWYATEHSTGLFIAGPASTRKELVATLEDPVFAERLASGLKAADRNGSYTAYRVKIAELYEDDRRKNELRTFLAEA